MKKTITAIAITAIILFAATASAATIYKTKGGYLAAMTKAEIQYIASCVHDKAALSELVKSGIAIRLKPGVRVYMQDSSWGFVKCRLVGKNISFWTFMEAIGK